MRGREERTDVVLDEKEKKWRVREQISNCDANFSQKHRESWCIRAERPFVVSEVDVPVCVAWSRSKIRYA